MTLTNNLTSGLTDGLVSGLIKSAGGVSFPAWDLSNATFSQEAANTGTVAHGMAWKPDGTQYLELDNSTDTINEFTLSTPFDLSTRSPTGVSFSVTTQENNPRTISYNNDGTAAYVGGLGADAVFQYTLPTPYSLTGISYASKTSSIVADTPTCVGGDMGYEGDKYYTLGNTNGVVQYSVTTPFDASTLSPDGNNFVLNGNSYGTVPTVENTFRGLFVHPNKDQFLVCSQLTDRILLFGITDITDVSTAFFQGELDISAKETQPTGAYITPDATALFFVGASSDKISKYTL